MHAYVGSVLPACLPSVGRSRSSPALHAACWPAHPRCCPTPLFRAGQGAVRVLLLPPHRHRLQRRGAPLVELLRQLSTEPTAAQLALLFAAHSGLLCLLTLPLPLHGGSRHCRRASTLPTALPNPHSPPHPLTPPLPSSLQVGAISRPNRAGASSACGALIACTSHLKSEGLDANLKTPGVHDPLEPE